MKVKVEVEVTYRVEIPIEVDKHSEIDAKAMKAADAIFHEYVTNFLDSGLLAERVSMCSYYDSAEVIK